MRQAIYGRLAGYEDVNDADRLARDPAMRAIIGREGLDRPAASSSEMGRFETEWLATEVNLAALTALSGTWIDRVQTMLPQDPAVPANTAPLIAISGQQVTVTVRWQRPGETTVSNHTAVAQINGS